MDAHSTTDTNRLTETSTEDAPSGDRWWITTGPLGEAGKKVLGPFCSQELALTVRSYVEAAGDGRTYWVDDEDPAPSGARASG